MAVIIHYLTIYPHGQILYSQGAILSISECMDPNTGIRDPTPATLTWTVNPSVAAAPVPHPKIMAIDGNRAPIVNGSSTTSSSITFSFADINGSNSFLYS